MHSRRTPAQTKQDPRQQQLRIYIARLHQNTQRDTHNRVADNSHTPHAHAVTQQAPGRTPNQRNQLVDKPQRAHRVPDIARLPDALRDHKRDGAVEEDEEADAEQGDPKQVRCDLRARRREGEAEHGLSAGRKLDGRVWLVLLEAH